MRTAVLHSLILLVSISYASCKDAPRHKPQSLIPFPRVGRSRPMPNRVGLLSASWPFNGDEYQELREGKRHLIPFPRVGKRQSLIPFPRVGKAFPSEEFDDDSLIEDPYKIYYPTGGDKQSNESPFRANIEYDIDYKNPAIPVGIPRHQGNEMLFIPQWLLSQEDN